MAGDVSADNELLTKVDAVLAPQPCPKSGLIDAIGTFGNNTFQTVRFHEFSIWVAVWSDTSESPT